MPATTTTTVLRRVNRSTAIPFFHYFARHGLNIVIGLGAASATAGVVAGAALAILYGRRASVSISASAQVTPKGVVVTARPSVKAVGLFRVKFKEKGGVTVRFTEIWTDGVNWKEGRFWEQEEALGGQYVDAGEEVQTTVLFQPDLLPEVIGWLVYIGVAAPTRLAKIRTGWWADRVFVARPEVT